MFEPLQLDGQIVDLAHPSTEGPRPLRDEGLSIAREDLEELFNVCQRLADEDAECPGNGELQDRHAAEHRGNAGLR